MECCRTAVFPAGVPRDRRIGAELAQVGDAFADATPDADVAVLYDSDSKFALSTQGPVPAATAR